MKIICVNIDNIVFVEPNSLILGKEYDLIYYDNDVKTYNVIDEHKKERGYHHWRFITQYEARKNKIKRLI